MEEKKYSVFDKLEEMKVKYYPKDMKACGQIILQAYINQFNIKPEKEERQIRYWRQVVNVYPASFSGKMGKIIKAYLKSPERREILNRPKQWDLNRIKHKEDFEKAQAKRAAMLLEPDKGQNKKEGKKNKKPVITSEPGPAISKSAVIKPAVIPPVTVAKPEPVESIAEGKKRVRQRIKVTVVKVRK